MKTIDRRLQKLERSLALRVWNGDDWGSLASVRDEIVRLAALQGDSGAAEIKKQLNALGPHGLWLEAVRGYLKDHGFVQGGDESLAETMARALNIGTDQLRMRIAQAQISSALRDRFGEVR
jgi:hypothetical protein